MSAPDLHIERNETPCLRRSPAATPRREKFQLGRKQWTRGWLRAHTDRLSFPWMNAEQHEIARFLGAVNLFKNVKPDYLAQIALRVDGRLFASDQAVFDA